MDLADTRDAMVPKAFSELIGKATDNVYGVGESAPTRNKTDFKQFAETFKERISRETLTSIMDPAVYEPTFWLIWKHAREPAYAKIIDEIIVGICAHLHKIYNFIGEEFAIAEDRAVQGFLRMIILLSMYLEKSITPKDEENLLGDDGEMRTRRKKDDGPVSAETWRGVVYKLRELSLSPTFRRMLMNQEGLVWLLVRGIRQCMKTPAGSWEDREGEEEQNPGIHIFEIFQQLLEIQVLNADNMHHELATLVADSDMAGRSVVGFLVMCFRSKHKVCELSLTTPIYLLRKYCSIQKKASEKSTLPSNIVKRVRTVLELIAEEMPEVYQAQMNEVLVMLESPFPPFRSAFLEILKQILLQKCGSVENVEKRTELGTLGVEALRADILGWIIQRTADKNIFCRQKALGDLMEILMARALPFEFADKCFARAAAHVKDPATFVRKKAMLLASEILAYYISTMKFPAEHAVEPELRDIRNRIEAEKKNELVSDDKDAVRARIQIATKYETLVLFYKQTYELIGKLVPEVIKLVFTTSADALEAIRLLGRMKTLGYHKVDPYLPKIFTLAFSEDVAVKSELKSTFLSLYVNKDRKQNACKNVVSLLRNCDRSTQICVLRLIRTLFEDGEKNKRLEIKSKAKLVLEEEMLKMFWNYFQEKLEEGKDIEDARFALKVCVEGFQAYPKMFYNDKLPEALKILKDWVGKHKRAAVDWEILSELARLVTVTKSGFELDNKLHELYLKALEEIIVATQGVQDLGWYSASQNLIAAIFEVQSCPEVYIERFINRISSFLGTIGEASYELIATKLTQMLWVAGEIAMKLMVRIEEVEEQLKSQKNAPANEEEIEQATGGFDSAVQAQRKSFAHLGELLASLVENQIIYGNIIGSVLPVVRTLGERIGTHKQFLSSSSVNTALAHCGLLTSLKFSTISQKYCTEAISSISEILSKDSDPVLVVKGLLAVRDLLRRFPQLAEPCVKRLFESLESPNKQVRLTALAVSSHLLLGDILKGKQELCALIMKIADGEAEIRRMIELFLAKLHHKDPTVLLGLIPDTLIKLATVEKLPNGGYDRIAKNLLAFADKEKHVSQIAESLVQVFKRKDAHREQVCAATCLSVLSSNLGLLKVLETQMDCYLDKLSIPEIKVSFTEILKNLRFTARVSRKKGSAVVAQVEALEEKLKPFLDLAFDEGRRVVRRGSYQLNKMDEEDSSANQYVSGVEEEESEVSNPKPHRRPALEADDQQLELAPEEEESEKSSVQPEAKKPRVKASSSTKPGKSKKSSKKGTKSKKKAKVVRSKMMDEDAEVDFDDEDDEDYEN